MNSSQPASLPRNPFTRPAFWGRQNELRTIGNRLLSQPPQCCAIIGETYFGKTTLLRYLSDPQYQSTLEEMGIRGKFAFVHLDCWPYIELAKMGDDASVQFWWDLYSESRVMLKLDQQSTLSRPSINAGTVPIDAALEIKSELEDLIRHQQYPVIFVLDNFEGIARLPLRDSEWLRAMAQRNCTYIVSSRYLLYLLYQYHPGSWANPSPLWNLFSDPIYIGLMKEEEVMNFIFQAGELASFWKEEDIEFIKRMAGRHPEVVRIVCARLYERRQYSRRPLKSEEYEFLEFSIDSDARPICIQLWQGLADLELWDIPGATEHPAEKETWALSPYQRALIGIANEEEITDKKILFVLEQRGLIERTTEKWRIFAEAMRRFVLDQEQLHKPLETRVFAYLEGRVYEYLKAHIGNVCDREEIKGAVWENTPPTNSALQKIIERIREKIEPDPENPRYLIAVRGQGYMLREDPLET